MWLSWIDNRTLFACQTILTAVYAIVFLSMGRMHRHLPATGSFALGFFSGFLGCVLIVLRGSLPNFVSIVIVNFLLFSAFVLFYRGILLFFRSPRTTRLLWTSVEVVPMTVSSGPDGSTIVHYVGQTTSGCWAASSTMALT